MPSLLAIILLALQAQRTSEALPSSPTGLEWMPIASVIVPAVLLVALIYLGSRRRV